MMLCSWHMVCDIHFSCHTAHAIPLKLPCHTAQASLKKRPIHFPSGLSLSNPKEGPPMNTSKDRALSFLVSQQLSTTLEDLPDGELISLGPIAESQAELTIKNMAGETLLTTSGSSLRSADLREADLTWANLTDADLTDADLTGADLTGVNLTWIVLQDANITEANLTEANLRMANLTRANLKGANLTGANLTGADLTGADLTKANLRMANLTRANLKGANLTGANLTGAIMPDGRIWEAYRADPLAGICEDPEARARALSAWGNHTWRNCPMHTAYGWTSIQDAPETKRLLVSAFIALFDSELLRD